MSDRLPEPMASGINADPLVGRTLADRFRVLELVARGGMGKIYKAEQLPLGRIVALKVLVPAERGGDEESGFRRRFEREAAVCSRLNHSNTVRVFDYGWTADGVYYLAMEFINGRTLHQLIKAEAPLPAGRVVHVLKQICASLAEAHATGIVHRDLKPGNILLTAQGDDRDFVKVVDFGLVKQTGDTDVTQAGMIVGSPMYMSPEQVRGEEIDPRTDVYALGMLAFVCLTGKRPFERDTPVQILVAQLSRSMPKMSEISPGVRVPASLQWLVETCLSPDRRDRFASTSEVLRALRVVEREIGGDPGPFLMSLRDGRVVVPAHLLAEISNPSLARQLGSPDPGPVSSGVTRTGVAAAGASLLLVLAIGGLGLFLLASAIGLFAWNQGESPALPAAAVADPSLPPRTHQVPEPVPVPVPAPVAAPVALPAPEPPVAAPRPVRPSPAPASAPAPVAAPVVVPDPPTPAPPAPEWKNDNEIKDPFAR